MLELNGIMKSYGTTRVLDDVTFQVAPGKLTGFVGGNGAGKTTTMRIILGVLARDGGTVTLNGEAVTAADRRRGSTRRSTSAGVSPRAPNQAA